MTVSEFKKALTTHRFILARHNLGFQVGLNSKILGILSKKKVKGSVQTNYVSFTPCSFMEYISKKTSFISSKP